MAFVSSGEAHLTDELVEIITDELNIKRFEFVAEAGRLVNYRVLPENKLLGPRFGARFPQVRAALAQMDPAGLAAAVQAGQSVHLEVDGQAVDLAPAELVVQALPVEGLAVLSEHGVTVAIDAALTPELRAEGLVREFVRRVQDLRKSAGLEVSDRIRLAVQASPTLAEALATWREYIMSETLALELSAGAPPEDWASAVDKFDGETVTFGLAKMEAGG